LFQADVPVIRRLRLLSLAKKRAEEQDYDAVA
jgi:hypothetical protein